MYVCRFLKCHAHCTSFRSRKVAFQPIRLLVEWWWMYRIYMPQCSVCFFINRRYWYSSLYLFRFRVARGDRKTAMRRLHAGALAKNHHFSTFRSGLFVGLALPALVTGLYHSIYQDSSQMYFANHEILKVFSSKLAMLFPAGTGCCSSMAWCWSLFYLLCWLAQICWHGHVSA